VDVAVWEPVDVSQKAVVVQLKKIVAVITPAIVAKKSLINYMKLSLPPLRMRGWR
jgi:hypothetical protein